MSFQSGGDDEKVSRVAAYILEEADARGNHAVYRDFSRASIEYITPSDR